MFSLPVINSSILLPTVKNVPTTSITTTQLIPTTQLVPTFPSTYVFNAVTPSFIYDSNLLARSVFNRDIPVFGYSLARNNDYNYKEDYELKRKCVEPSHDETKSNNNCCCCCCNCNDDKKSVKIDNETKVEETKAVVTATIQNESKQETQIINTEHKCEKELNDLKLNQLSLEEKISLIRKELNLHKKEEAIENNALCFCKPFKPVDDQNVDIPMVNTNETTKYVVNYMPIHKEKCDTCSYNENYQRSRPTSCKSARTDSRSKSPKSHWTPIGRNYYSNRLQFNDYSNDITKIQHLGGINNVNINNSSISNTISKTNNSTQVQTTQKVVPLKYYTITTKIPAKTVIRTTIDSNNYYPTLKYKESMSSVNYTPSSVNMSKWSSQNY